jgi:hypothetical protein
VNDVLIAIQRQISDQLGEKVDVHYQEGKGALVVPHLAPLVPANVITAIPDIQLQMMKQFKEVI